MKLNGQNGRGNGFVCRSALHFLMFYVFLAQELFELFDISVKFLGIFVGIFVLYI